MTRDGKRLGPLLLVVFVIVVGLLGSTWTGIAPAASANSPTGSHLGITAEPIPSETPSAILSSPVGLPGSDPTGEIPVPPDFHPTGFPVHEPLSQVTPSRGTPAPSPGSLQPSSARLAPLSDDGANVIVMGTVLESTLPHLASADALVTAETVGTDCSLLATCPTALTNGHGEFSLSGVPAGTIQVTVAAAWNVTNYTTLFNVAGGGEVSTGVIYVVPDAIVSGCVAGDDSTHEAAGGIQVTGYSLLGMVAASPDAITNGGTGCFDDPGVAVPPGPAVIQFNSTSPYPIYEANSTDVDLQPGEHYALSSLVYLNVGERVTVEPYNTVTKAPIDQAGFISVTLYHRPSGFGFGWGQPVNESQVALGVEPAAIGLPGLSTLSLGADGFADNESSVVIPAVPFGQSVNLGKVWLVPDGVVTGTFGFQGSPGIESSPWYAATVAHDYVVMNVCSLSGIRFASSAPNVSVVVASTPSNANVSFDNCVSTCQALGQPFAAWAAPLRDAIGYQPDTKGLCGPEANPYTGLEPGWPIPDALPVFGNYFGSNFSFANVTPDLETPSGQIDFTAGTYVVGTAGPGSSWTVEVCSTDESVECMDPAGPINTAGIYGPCTAAHQGNFSYCPDDPTLCPSPTGPGAGQTFCAPAPEGPDQFSVSSPTQGSNVTWAYIPATELTSGPLALDQVSTFHVQSINLSTDPPNVTGEIRNARTGAPIPDDLSPVLNLAPAGQAPGVGSTNGSTGGSFVLNATPGWVMITAQAANFETNSTWVQVNDLQASQDAGTIDLTPLAWLSGEVLTASGTPMLSASVSTCPLGSLNCAAALQSGITGTGGEYAAEVSASGPFPLGTYEVEASAPGYVANATWVNVTTPGEVVQVPPIRLTSFLDAGDAGPGLSANPEEYVVGEIVDNATGAGIEPAAIDLTPTSGGPTAVLEGTQNTGGFFNYTVPTGTYWANVTVADYAPVSLFLNVSGLQPQLDLGRIALSTFPGFLTGLVDISPWGSLTTEYGLAPGTIDVTVCEASNPSICAEAPAGSGGRYNVTAPWGMQDVVSFNPVVIVGAGVGGAPDGFLNATARVNVEPGVPTPYLTTGLTIFGAVVGDLLDQTTNDTTPVPFATVGVTVQNPLYGKQSATEISGGTGEFTAIVPPGVVSGSVAGTAFVPATFQSPTDLANVTAGNVSVVGPLSTPHDGWITGRVLPAVPSPDDPHDWVSGVIAEASAVGANAFYTANNGYFNILSGNQADDTGRFNITAPPSGLDTLDIVAPDYSQINVENLRVNQSETTVIAPGTLPAMVPWGWTTGTIVDPTIDQPVAGAFVAAADLTETLRSNPLVVSSTTGQFVTDAPPGSDVLTARHPDDRTNSSELVVASGAFTDVGLVDVAGWGTVAGEIAAWPSGDILVGANVTVCPFGTPLCTNDSATTNGTGVFWAAAPPGVDLVSVSAPGFSANTSSIVDVGADSFQFMGIIQLTQFATVTGMVLGSPSGLPLPGANASLCASAPPVEGGPAGPCAAEAPTDARGQFTLVIGAGEYVLALTDAGYAPSYVTVAIAPGEQVGLGIFLLAIDGTIVGSVLGANTLAAIPGTTVTACATGSSMCGAVVAANATGVFSVAANPGAFTVTASAPGYQDGYARAFVTSAEVVDVGTIDLVPIGPNTEFTVSGTVRAEATGLPIPGVIVEAGGYASNPALPNGSYEIGLPYGSYDLLARAPGYSPAGLNVTVHDNLSGVDFLLSPTSYSFFGVVDDGLTTTPIAGVTLVVNSTIPLTTTGPSGAFDASFENGSYRVTFSAPSTTDDANVTVTVTINGASVERNVSLSPPLTTIEGLVVNAQTGLPIPNATVAVDGVTISGVHWTRTYAASALGTLDVPLYQGNYTLNASAGGYLPLRENLTANGTSRPLVFSLAVANPSQGHATGTSVTDEYLEFALLAAAILAGLVLVVLLARRGPRRIDAELGPERFSKVLSGAPTTPGTVAQIRLHCPSCGADFDAPAGPPGGRRPANLTEEMSFAAVCPSCGVDVEYEAQLPNSPRR